jgi:hypothetical protein
MSDFTWSFSSLKQYQNCPKQYYELTVAKNFVQSPSQAMIYGNQVHSALEHYVKDGTELPKNYQRFKPLVDDLTAIPGDKLTEHRMALTKEKTPCTFGAKERWVRGIADIVIVDGNHAFIVDYKTGSDKYPDLKSDIFILPNRSNYPIWRETRPDFIFNGRHLSICHEGLEKVANFSCGSGVQMRGFPNLTEGTTTISK